MKEARALIPPHHPLPGHDRILERVLDFFDEFEGLDKTSPEGFRLALDGLSALKLRIAAALWSVGDSRHAFLLGLPEDPEARRVALEFSEGEAPRSFIGTFTVDGIRHQEERMALCRLQAMAEFRRLVARRFGSAEGVFIQVEMKPEQDE
ncbi:MAG TPA: hypothetical protein VIE43_07635 [Thermoanaerobaculia bacterium]|jgi:hypothetical protein|nr:hypothetical protein [Thermoanaerobaculia bacterium]